jgi:poly-beta-1,6-N-acetyl-D-glucosamine synthase
MHYLVDFAFYYPLFMAYLWMIGGVYFYLNWEKKDTNSELAPVLAEYPPVSVIIPCYNEGAHVVETIESMLYLAYPDYEIIAVNDGSSDDTGEKLNLLAAKHAKVKVIHLASNQGKATGLCTAAMLSKNEFLMCIDGDAILDTHCITWMMRHFNDGPRIGAVTGNPRIRNRSSLLGKLQVGEFSSIIGLIKRAQRVYGRIFTVSGVVAMFRKSALHQAGYWSTNMITEDIDISWKLQTNHWGILFEPNALCWILMPETLKGLFKQRVRWAQGGAEVLLKYFDIFHLWRKRRMWIVYFELITSIFWAYIMMGIILLWAIGLVIPLPPEIAVKTLLPGWNGVILGFTCLLQFGISLYIDSRYERQIKRYYYWMIWYPMLFWLISALTAVIGLPKAVIRNKKQKAVWTSPDRGLRQLSN